MGSWATIPLGVLDLSLTESSLSAEENFQKKGGDSKKKFLNLNYSAISKPIFGGPLIQFFHHLEKKRRIRRRSRSEIKKNYKLKYGRTVLQSKKGCHFDPGIIFFSIVEKRSLF